MIYQKKNIASYIREKTKFNRTNSAPRSFSVSAPLLVLFLLATIIAPLTPLFTNQTSAVSVSDMTPTDRAQSWAYLNALRKCVRDSLGQRQAIDITHFGNLSDGYWKDQVEEGSARSGHWWKDEFKVEASYLITAADENGKAACNDILENGAQVWGYGSDFMSLLCSFMPTRANGSSCSSGSDYFNNFGSHADDFDQVIKDRIYGGQAARASSVELYPIYRAVFLSSQGCQARASTIAPGQGNGDIIYRDIKVVDPSSGKVTTTTFEGASHGTTKSIYTDDFLNVNQQNCGYIADRLNEYANDYSDAIIAQKKPDTTSGGSNLCATNPNDPSCKETTTTCKVDGVGWIVCPISNFLASITDGLFSVLTLLLATAPLTADSPAYSIWSTMRNIANVAFVIAFIFIIYSQLTGFGINNYGIKKILPRIIVAAILVNISYWICAFAVDVSNILGSSVRELMMGLIPDTAKYSLNVFGTLTAWILAGAATITTIGGITFSVMAAGGWLAALALLLPVMISALFAIITVVLVLAARQALIIILIVISPLAFVAYLLPNTEEWFGRWRKLFTTLLLLFPIISFIFGGSQLAASIVRSTAENPIIYILSLAIQVVPLFLTPLIMKFSGGLLARFGGVVNNPNKGPFDRLKKSAQGFAEVQQTRGRAAQLASGRRSGAVTRWRLRRNAQRSGVENVLKRAEAGYVAEEIKGDEAFRNRAAGGSKFTQAPQEAQRAVYANAISALDKMEDEDTSNREKLMRHGKDPSQMIDVAAQELASAISEGDIAKALAAQRILKTSGNMGLNKLQETLEATVTTEEKKASDVVRNLRSDLNSSGLKGKNNVLAKWAYNDLDKSLADTAADASTLQGLTDIELAGQSYKMALQKAPAGAISQAQAQSIIDSPNIWRDIDEDKKVFFEQIAGRQSIHRQSPQVPSASAPQGPSSPAPQAPAPSAPPANPMAGRNTPPPGTGGYRPNNNGLYTPPRNNGGNNPTQNP